MSIARELYIVRPGPLAVVQDRGRFGHYADGVATGGALDHVAYRIVNLIVGNEPNAAVVEITFGGFCVQFISETYFALSGADCMAELDGSRVDAWKMYCAQAGSTLSLHSPRSGVRSYLAVEGGIDVPRILGSRSTDVIAGFGGYCGRALRTGDRLPIGSHRGVTERVRSMRIKPPQWDFARDAFEQSEMPIRFLETAEMQQLDNDDRTCFLSPWIISPQSNRMGIRLSGNRIARDCGEMLSHAVYPGVIQLPKSGEPIVLLADAGTTGGYPKVGVVIAADLWKIAQLQVSMRLRFVPSTLDQAAEARREVEAYLHAISQAITALAKGG